MKAIGTRLGNSEIWSTYPNAICVKTSGKRNVKVLAAGYPHFCEARRGSAQMVVAERIACGLSN